MSNEDFIINQSEISSNATVLDKSGPTAEEIQAELLRKEEASTLDAVNPYVNVHKGEKIPYYIGLDIGTDSIGMAATNESYDVLRFRGEPMMCSHLFDAAEGCAVRRQHRAARRRLDRRQQRVQLIREIFAKEVYKIDPDFFLRQQATILAEKEKTAPTVLSLFDDEGFKDADFYAKYPTIYHLMQDLRTSDEPKDVRLLCLAVCYLVAHRGHFVYQVDKDNVSKVLSFEGIYNEFIEALDGFEPWTAPQDLDALAKVVKDRTGIKKKKDDLKSILFDGKKLPKVTDEDPFDVDALVSLLAGGKVELAKIFNNPDMKDAGKIQLSDSDESIEAAIGSIGDLRIVIDKAKQIYDWGVLASIMGNHVFISDAKVAIYEQHKRDLKTLRSFARRYGDTSINAKGDTVNPLYNRIFNDKTIMENYCGYSKGVKSKTEFCAWLLKEIESSKYEEKEAVFAENGNGLSAEQHDLFMDMIARLDPAVQSFLPKQVSGDNRILPYQVFYAELKAIIDKCSVYLPFLTEADEDGLTPYQKILDVFSFRIPYYVGPLNNHSEFAWIVRKADKIYPWNFEQVVDLDMSEEWFIKRMINQCTYLASETVLPVNSLLYSKFAVLNEINNLRIEKNDGKVEFISVATKQGIFEDIYKKKSIVRIKDIENYLRSNGFLQEGDKLKGIDTGENGKKTEMNNQYRSYHVFKRYIDGAILTEVDVEDIINRMAYSEDNLRLQKWLSKTYPNLQPADRKKIAALNLKKFGRLSHRFLAGSFGLESDTEQMMSIIDLLWNTNANLQEILYGDFDYIKRVDRDNHLYYQGESVSIAKRIDNLYVSPAVKRSIIRTIDVVGDVVKAMGKTAPKAIFVEMAKGEEKQKERTVDRKSKIADYYKAFQKGEYHEDIQRLINELNDKSNRDLQGKALFLYFMQLGKDMYTGERLDIDNLSHYNIDHIYPQSKVKDDSFDNMVLVSSRANSEKGDGLVKESVIKAQKGFWYMLRCKGLISDEKYKRLTRKEPFSEEELVGFINRQLVETRQSSKAVCELLKELYPETDVVYVKAGLVSEFRSKFFYPKARSVNDLHHAKDAYLNIVVGDMYYRKFTKHFARTGYRSMPKVVDGDGRNEQGNSAKNRTLFTHKQWDDGKLFWNGYQSLKKVRALMNKDNVHLTKYACCGHGGLFDEMPKPGKEGTLLIPRKKELVPVSKFGGYKNASLGFYVLAKFISKKKTKLLFVPIELQYASIFEKGDEAAMQCIKNAILTIDGNANLDTLTLPLGMRKIKLNTVISLDGMRVSICGKANGGEITLLAQMTPLFLDPKSTAYVKRLEAFVEKQKKDRSRIVNDARDGITKDDNLALYDLYVARAQSVLFKKIPMPDVATTLISGRSLFAEELQTTEQVSVLLNIVNLFKSNRKGAINLEGIGGKKTGCVINLSSNIANWTERYHDVRIIDSSASGIFESRSINLLELL